MEFWTLWFIGIAITIVTRIAISILSNYDIFDNKWVKIIISFLVIICIFIVGGIIVGKWIGNFAFDWWSSCSMSELVVSIFFIIVTTIFGAIITYLAGYFILGLYHFDDQTLYVIVFIVSIICWSIPICHYNQNIEYLNQTVVVSQEERQLLYFCNIPVQNVSGEISGSFILGAGNVSGKITTSDTLPYWYSNQNDEAIFDSASATDSKIIFIDDDESPYIEIIVYSDQTVSKNHNNGTEKVTTDKTWTKYNFYLPDSIMQYNLN